MAASLRVLLFLVVGAFQCSASRDERDDSKWSVTHAGILMARDLSVHGGSARNGSFSAQYRQSNRKQRALNSILSVEAALGTSQNAQSAHPPTGAPNGDAAPDPAGTDAKDANETKKEEGDNVYNLSQYDKIMLEIGWLAIAIGFLAVLLIFVEFWPYRLFEEAPTADSSKILAEQTGPTSQFIYEAMWGQNVLGTCISGFIVLMALANFMCFALRTEVDFGKREAGGDLEKAEPGLGIYLGVPLRDWVPRANHVIQNTSLGIIVLFIALRCAGALAHPKWARYGGLAPLVFLIGDVYTHIEIIGVIPTILDDISGEDRFMNLTWICIFRTIEMVSRQGALAAALRSFKSLRDEWVLIRMVLGYAMLLWVFMSGCFCSENWNNPDSVWEAAEYKGKKWQRYASIPSSMWFTMVNLSCEWPQADVFTTPLARIIAMSCAFIGVPLWAVPSGIIGNAVQEKVTEIQDEKDESDDSISGLSFAAREERKRELESFVHVAWTYFVFFASFGSVIVFFFWTASRAAHLGQLKDQTELIFFKVHIDISDRVLAWVDGSVAAVFAIHMGYELHQRFNQQDYGSYFRTIYFWSDLMSWLPGLVHLIFIELAHVKPPDLLADLIRGACVFRVLKPDRYIGAFKEWFSILFEHAVLLQVTAFIAFLLLLVTSTAFYYTEYNNPDGAIREYYGSAARSVWSVMINLHGEWPWADYSTWGKAVGAWVDLVGIAICMVPIAIFADGYTDRLMVNEEDSSLHRKPWEKQWRPSEEGVQLQTYDLLYSHLHFDHRKFTILYKTMRASSLSLSVLSCIATTALSAERFNDRAVGGKWESLDDHIRTWLWIFFIVDGCCAAFFCIEYLLRTFATKGMYSLSISGTLDLVSTTALVASLTSYRSEHLHPDYTHTHIIRDMVVPARLLRCFCLDNYFHFSHTLKTVAWLNWKPLCRSLYCLFCMWYIFGTCLYFTERPKQDVKETAHQHLEGSLAQADEDDDLTMENRYSDVLTGLQYALVHITGDYPITEYKLESMPFHVIFVIAGMVSLGAFSGIFTAGFSKFLEEEHGMERREAARKRLDGLTGAVLFIQTKFRLRKRRMQAALMEAGGSSQADEFMSQNQQPFQPIRDIVDRKTRTGEIIMLNFNAALIVNIACIFLNSIDEIHDKIPRLLSSLLAVSLFIFVVEYVFRLLAGSPPFSNVLQFMRIIDLICLIPGIVEMVRGSFFESATSSQIKHEAEWQRWMDCARLFRLVRILDFPAVRLEVRRTLSTFRLIGSALIMPSILGLSVWAWSASMFMWAENKYNGYSKKDMGTVPDSMYFCSFFILGEWANVDFSFGAGSRVCIFYCLVGIVIFAVPVGIISSAVENSLKQIVEEQKEVQRLYNLGKGLFYVTPEFPAAEPRWSQPANNLGAPMIPSYALALPSHSPAAGPPPPPPSMNQGGLQRSQCQRFSGLSAQSGVPPLGPQNAFSGAGFTPPLGMPPIQQFAPPPPFGGPGTLDGGAPQPFLGGPPGGPGYGVPPPGPLASPGSIHGMPPLSPPPGVGPAAFPPMRR